MMAKCFHQLSSAVVGGASVLSCWILHFVPRQLLDSAYVALHALGDCDAARGATHCGNDDDSMILDDDVRHLQAEQHRAHIDETGQKTGRHADEGPSQAGPVTHF